MTNEVKLDIGTETRAAEQSSGDLSDADLDHVSGGGLLATTITNLANMRHEMLKAVANNLRA